MTIIPVILCGGAGTRLWPLSRQSSPKQFARISGEESLFQASARRVTGPGFAPPLVMTTPDYRFVVTEQLRSAGLDTGTVLIEPMARNTAPAILAVALYLQRKDPDAVMLVVPSDHLIPDAAAFQDRVRTGLPVAQAGDLVTFGVTPDRPETGYGYLELTAASQDDPVRLKRFVEKPDAARAQEMIQSGTHLWNAGIFLFAASALVSAVQAHAPDLMDPVRAAVDGIRQDLDFYRLAPDRWAQVQDISIDYAVMERASNLWVVPFSGLWSDLGDWDAVRRAGQADAAGNVADGPATLMDCTDSLVRSEADGLEVVGIGLKNTVVVATPDAVLVADMDRAQDVKEAVVALKAKEAKQATQFPRDNRPWGWFETLALSDRFQVKRIVVNPGAALSLQSHHHRSEHWIVVHGTAKVTIDDVEKLVAENASVYIPLGSKHRLENPGKVPMVLIEVQTGTYLGEDDIVRYEDLYARGGDGELSG